MKKTILRAALVLASLSVTFVACKKEDKEPSQQELIMGTWNLEASGVDTDQNNILESSESDTLDPSDIAQLVFSANGLGVSKFGRVGEDSLGEEQFRWTLSPDGKTLRIEQGLIFNSVVTQLTQNRLAYYFEENGEHHFEIWKR